MNYEVKHHNVEKHDNGDITISGTRYSYEFFEAFGCDFPSMVGQVVRIDKKENGLVTITSIPDMEV